MEQGQKFKIALDSSLDVHQSDMLVSAQQPTLLHNRQKFQGTTLPTSLRYEHDGWAAGWDVYQFKFNDDQMEFYYTDTRDENLTEELITSQNSKNEFQFLKQQWDTTVATENFFWVDSSHIVAITKSKIILRRKTDELHDWNGDVWIDEKEWRRDQLTNDVVYAYGATSAYGGASALLYIVSVQDNALKVTFYDPLNNLSSWSYIIPKNKRDLGSALNPSGAQVGINTYADVLITTIASMSKYSATRIGDTVIFGIHFDKNYNQWAVVGNVGGSHRVIQGYGYVGVNGTLTGGEIPSKYFSADRGFTGAVEDIEIYARAGDIQDSNISDLSELYNFRESVVGNAETQWYISRQLSGIISHLTYSNGSFVAQELPLNNNYSEIYQSPSFNTKTISDIFPTVKPVADMFPSTNEVFNSAINAALVILGYPLVFLWHIRFNTFCYLHQTIGQYAYVHYNNTVRKTKDTVNRNDSFDESSTAGPFAEANYNYKGEAGVSPLDSDEIAFDLKTISQKTETNSEIWNWLPGIFVGMFVSALDWNFEKLQINSEIQQNDTVEKGRKFSISFSANAIVSAISDFYVKGVSSSMFSAVVSVKSLDMFYSTSDQQHVNAGPGYVSHAFVAQCIAQSTTSTQVDLNQISAGYVIWQLTEYQYKLEQAAVDNALLLMIDERDDLRANEGNDKGGQASMIAAQALTVAIDALRIEQRILDMAAKAILPILKSTWGDRTQVNITAALSKHSYDMEGKHRYGAKSECFMYPCFDCEENTSISDEGVSACVVKNNWFISQPIVSDGVKNVLAQLSKHYVKIYGQDLPFVTDKVNDDVLYRWYGDVPYYVANCKGFTSRRALPSDTAYVIGTETFLPKEPFRNENISETEPVFPVPVIQDYIIDKSWQLGQTCIGDNGVFWISCKDTKLIDCPPSNIVISPDFCGVACSYTAVEVKRGITRKYLRPWAITPQVLALNNTGLNSCYEEKAYHSFDGYGYRLVNWVGAPGLSKEHQTWQYSYLINNRFKRSNKLDCNQFLGNFKSDPIIALKGDKNDKVYVLATQPSEGKGLQSGTAEEDKDVRRYAVPVFTEFVGTLPAVVKTLSSYNLITVDGITGLASDLRNGQATYKIPVSIDFNIGNKLYRMTSEYICAIENSHGLVMLKELVPVLGLTYLGSTPYEAYLYSQATRQYYKYTGGTSLSAINMIERFRNVVNGRYDFVNQEVIVPCLATFERVDKFVHDDVDETDNVIIPRVKDNQFKGEIAPPIKTIYNTRSWFRTLSLPCGVTYQGPNRCIINRFVYSEYMRKSIVENYGKWRKVPREEYHPFRKYKAEYQQVDQDIGDIVEVKGWTHNPFLFVTSPIGLASESDCLFEWEITFAWPVEMDALYGINDYAVVNISAETMTSGGKTYTRPVHVFLYKELFTRTGNYGYYSFRYQSKGGSGNRERLHLWSDQYIAISGVQCDIKVMSQKRSEILTQQLDVQQLHEI